MDNSHRIVIVGAGLSGLSIAHFLRQLEPKREVLVLEADSRPGGAIRSFSQDGFRGEWGPHGFLDNNEASRALLRETGLDKEALRAPLGEFSRFVCHRGRLVELPQTPGRILATSLISLGAKFRILAELWKKPRPSDQTIGQWVEYRFGPELLPLVDAAVTGSFAGDYRKLSIGAVMPGARRLELEHGSLIRGLLKKKKTAKTPGRGLPAMINFPEGMERLITVLARECHIRFDCSLNEIKRGGGGWELQTAKGPVAAETLVMALPVNRALQLLASFLPPPVSKVPTAKIVNVVMAFPASARVPRGFGYLAAEREKRFTLGAMFSSHMFPDRTPPGTVLLEALVGGRRHPERLELSDEEIAARVYEDMSQLLHLPEPPIFTKVLRPSGGIPQLEMDHPALLTWLRQLEGEQSNLHLSGFGWQGIGMNDMMKAAQETAQAIHLGRAQADAPAPVKPVYF